MGEKYGGFLDEGDLFPQAVRAVREARTRVRFRDRAGPDLRFLC
jgi:hypothetical protein